MNERSGVEFGFEKLEVWQKAVALATTLYSVTKSFPREELFGLTMQLRRAGVSVPANIAEGNSRSSGKEKAHFLQIAYGSLCEIATMLQIAALQGLVSAETNEHVRVEISDLCRMLSGLRRASLGKKE